ncbi:M15 family metallopeptidase [Nocardiopsis suaedae]|uniref:M15 family metallopeptidase n=1 Tax=Nocardiopsis suaedae TaxID=3018444 RepID=A0ABT4TU68_9ACTN|nr:M15 family metallopeptidase [Nocardiopsis suaedae]MDA2808259.1 M15 family metallopeptidase [Nocardiopsis suaedae]
MGRRNRTKRALTAAVCAGTVLAVPAAPAAGAPEDPPARVRAALAEVRAEIDSLHERAESAMRDHVAESERLDRAEEAARSAERAADNAAEHTERVRTGAAGQAVAAYTGADLGPLVAWSSPRGPQEALDRASFLSVLAGHRQDEVNRAAAAGAAKRTLSDRAAEARDERADAEEAARETREEAESALEDRRATLRGLLAEQSRLEEELRERREQEAEESADGRGGAQKQAGQAAQTSEGAGAPQASEGTGGGGGAGDGGDGGGGGGGGQGCDGGDLSGYPNGEIPEEALCPLPQPGERLRADAAEAFIALDGEFQGRFGRPMCVADSYRPIDEQVRLYEEKAAGMAAAPGTSTHGRGIAVDLCGGVETEGSDEYRWMMENAPDHGWLNPEWAQNGFEPWHWEFQG